jgi:hypothetical protein
LKDTDRPSGRGRARPWVARLRAWFFAELREARRLKERSPTMKIRSLSALGFLTATVLVGLPGSAQSPKTVDSDVDKVEVAEGKVRATIASGAVHSVLPGDKGFFLKDGAKVEGSEFEIDRVEDRLALFKTGFTKVEDARSQTSLKVRITTTRTCPRNNLTRPNLDDKAASEGKEPAPGFAFAKVTSAEKVHKTKIKFTIDKGTDDGVLPSSVAYSLKDGPGRTNAYYTTMDQVAAKTATGFADAGDADEMLKNVKRIGFQRVVCPAAK